MNIVFTNLYSAANRGDAAIVLGMKEALEECFPNSDFVVLSKFHRAAQELTGIRSSPPLLERLKFFGYLELVYFLIWAYLRKTIKLPTLGREERIKYYLDADLIISVGGGYLNDNYPVALIRWLFEFYFAKLLGKKVVIYANSVGPFERSWARFLTRFVFNKLDLITLRDPQSKEILDSVGVDSSLTHVTADAAWCMNTTSREQGLALLKDETGLDINDEKLKVSISLRRWRFYTGDNTELHENYIKSIGKLVNHLIETEEAHVFFLSTSTALGGYLNDDRQVAEEVFEYINKPGSARILQEEYSPQQLSAIYSNMDLHIGTRMHSNILAMLGETPIFAIEYEPKTEGLMNSFGLGKWIVKIEQISPEVLIRMVDEAIENRDTIKDQVVKILPDMKRKSQVNAKLVKDLIRDDL